jgi:hypothetical protein
MPTHHNGHSDPHVLFNDVGILVGMPGLCHVVAYYHSVHGQLFNETLLLPNLGIEVELVRDAERGEGVSPQLLQQLAPSRQSSSLLTALLCFVPRLSRSTRQRAKVVPTDESCREERMVAVAVGCMIDR